MTLTNIARYDKGIVYGTETEITQEGYIKSRAIVTRCGVFLYKNADGTIRKELRHPDDVLEPESLETIKMIPIVNGHPQERLINADNAKRLSVGFTGELVENEYPHIIANLLITDKNAVNDIKEKKKNELSLGYTVDLIEEKGLYHGEPYDFKQTNIRYNHLALVDEARAGPEARIALDGNDAELILKEDKGMSAKKMRKVKVDAEEYMLEDDAAKKMEHLMAMHKDLHEKHMKLMDEHEHLKHELEKAHAERDTMRDKDYHDPEKVHHPLEEEDGEFPHHLTEAEEEEGGRHSHMNLHKHREKDEIGTNGKEEHEPMDTYGMQSHVKDYEKPSHLESHVVKSPKNEHYPHDLPHIAKVDAAEINRKVKERVRLEKLCERYLDKKTFSRIDSLDDFSLKQCLIKTLQPKANLVGKSQAYINARFDSVCENLPSSKVIVSPAYKLDENDEKDQCDASEARKRMIQRQKLAYKGAK